MTEPIIWNGIVLAYVIRAGVTQEKTIFPTPPYLELQVGFVVYPAGGIIAPHRHRPVTRDITRTCEVIVVKKGRCDVDLYNDDHDVIATRELNTGDLFMLVNGWHGFRMKEDTVLIEVKQGPYLGLTEKELLQ
jgi:cupin fold WbuC family metalloprotein